MPIVKDIRDFLVPIGESVTAINLARAFADGERNVVCNVENYTDKLLRMTRNHHDQGNFKVPPISESPPGQTNAFSLSDTGFMTGVEGWLWYYIVDSNPPTRVSIRWNNPFVGANSCSGGAYVPGGTMFSIPPSDLYRVVATCCGGNTSENRYEIRPV